MKKIKIFVITTVILLGLTGCSYSDIFGGKDKIDNDSANANIKDTSNKTNSSSNKAVDVDLGQQIEYPDNYTISFLSSNFTKKVVPTNPDSYYSYYEAKDKDNNTYFVLKTNIKNLGTEKLEGEKLPDAKLIYDEKYKYDAFLVTEEDDGSDLEGYDWYMDIDPLKTKKIWYLVEIPNEVENETNKSLVMEYQFNDKTYHVSIR